MYHFLSGYTARVAGTEKGVTEPQATFSTCFGAPFMPRHPTVYAKMLGEKMARQHVKCWLVNTGWSGGGFGVGERMSIRHTRAMVRAALDGTLAAVASSTDPHFGMQVPSACPDVPRRGAEPEEHLEGQEGLRQRRARRRPALRGQLPAVREPRRRQGQQGGDPRRGVASGSWRGAFRRIGRNSV